MNTADKVISHRICPCCDQPFPSKAALRDHLMEPELDVETFDDGGEQFRWLNSDQESVVLGTIKTDGRHNTNG